MRITSGGNVGIGETSPASKLSIGGVQGSTIGSNVALLVGNNGAAGTVGNMIQIGLHYNPAGATPASVIGAVFTSTAGYTKSDIFFATRDVTTDTAPTERMRITSGGNVGIGTTSPNARLDLGTSFGASGEKFFVYNDDASSALAGTKMGFYIDRFSESNSVTFVFPYAPATTSRYHVAYKNTGNTTITDVCYVTHNSTSWTFPSDERMKNVEGIIPNALDKIKDLRAVYYTQKRDPEQKRKVGLLAQDLLEVLPEVVDVPDTELDSDGNQRYMSVALADTIPLLVKAIQELSTKLDEATTRIKTLESR
jgi:hypothetical protein